MAQTPELSGVSIVGAGSFNPAIFQPRWLEDRGLISAAAAEAALTGLLVTPDLTAFSADWLTVQVGLQQLIFSTVDEGRDVDLRDVTVGALTLLPETPVDAVGINHDAHFRLSSESSWHAMGDLLAPKDFWEPVFESGGHDWRRREDGHFVGLRTMTVETHRETPLGYVRIEVGPSVRVLPHAIYVGVNTHFQLTLAASERSNGYSASQTISEHWQSTRDLERAFVDRVMAGQ